MSHAGPQRRSRLGRHRQFSPTASIKVSPLCLGTMSFGDGDKEAMGECTKETAFAIMDRFVKLGGNFFDTSNMYQKEESEIWLGEWMETRKIRDQLVVATKYTSAWKAYLGDELIQSNFGGNNAKSMKISLAESLVKLRTIYVDILYVHWWDYSTSIPELMQSLNDLVTSGKVIYLGASDTPAWVVAKANQYARDHGLRQFSVFQGLWNAAMRDMERDIVPMCRDEGMAIVPWGAIGQGRFQTSEGYAKREKSNPGRKAQPVTETDKKAAKALESVAEKRKGTIFSVALAYLLLKAPYVFPLIGCRTLEHLEGNVKVFELRLTEDDIREIDEAYGFKFGYPHTFLWEAFGDPDEGAVVPQDVWLTKVMGTFDWVEQPKAIPFV